MEKKTIIITSSVIAGICGLGVAVYYLIPYPGHGGYTLHKLRTINNDLIEQAEKEAAFIEQNEE